jgi:hypothetical protein
MVFWLSLWVCILKCRSQQQPSYNLLAVAEVMARLDRIVPQTGQRLLSKSTVVDVSVFGVIFLEVAIKRPPYIPSI